MKTTVRFFALFVAIAGLASASLAPANSQVRTLHNSVTVNDPVPTPQIPAPLPCQFTGTCFASGMTTSR